ncbi:MAG TPA: ATPase domain-containing protein [Nitrososphaerales archaeon]|nr:ATPase domain-containing protein [Nitrososphaerales archaeon]
MTESEATARKAVERVSGFPYLGSGSKAIDRLLGGGYRAGRLTEVFGRSNTGKSQLAMQASLLAAKQGIQTLFLDTEGSFRPERLEEMAKARGWKTDGILEKILYVRVDSSSEQMETAQRMEARAPTAPCKLVVVDTLTRNFSLDLPGRSNLSSRQAALDVYLSQMARDAYLHGRAYLLTNRVTYGASHDVRIGGRTVEQLVDASLRLERQGDEVKAQLMSTGETVTAVVDIAGLQ